MTLEVNGVAQQTLADVLAAVKATASISKKEKDGLASSVRSTGRWLHRNLEDIPADAATLNESFAGVHHVQVGVSAKRFGNVLSDLKVALKIAAEAFAKPKQGALSPKIRAP